MAMAVSAVFLICFVRQEKNIKSHTYVDDAMCICTVLVKRLFLVVLSASRPPE